MLTRALHALSKTAAFCWFAACNPIVVDAFEAPDARAEPVDIDRCPDDPFKVDPGGCGCGTPDHDFDEDGALDCIESCPDNSAQTEPMGECGCSGSTDTSTCSALRAALLHRYAFNDRGLDIIDSVSGSNGSLSHLLPTASPADLASLQQNGRLHFDGVGSYVQLPPGMISSLPSATFEVWLTWRGGPSWSRIFDFGDNDGNSGQSYLFLTPSNTMTNAVRVAYSLAGNAEETVVDGMAPLLALLPRGQLQHVAVVIDEVVLQLSLYVDGEQVGSEAFVDSLAAVNDANNWLGRSNYVVDPPFFGSLIEFRIYEQALAPEQIRASFEAGPGALD